MRLFSNRKPIVNKIIGMLIVSDIILISAFGLVGPIFAIYITDQIKGGTIAVAGFAQAIFLATKSLLQLPLARALDIKKGERDDYVMMLIGSFLFAAVPVIYIFAKAPWHIYLAQFVFGVSAALNFPGWMALFTRHIDKEREALTWSLHNASFQLGAAAAAAIGAIAAQKFGFKIVFVVVAAAMVLGSLPLLRIRRDILDEDHLQDR